MGLDLLAEFESLVVALERAAVPYALCGGLAGKGHAISTVSRAGLIAMKRLAGRLQDLADIEKLEGSDG